FFFNDTATTEIYTLSLHDALPISLMTPLATIALGVAIFHDPFGLWMAAGSDRKSTRLNSRHLGISYAVFCLEEGKGIGGASADRGLWGQGEREGGGRGEH